MFFFFFFFFFFGGGGGGGGGSDRLLSIAPVFQWCCLIPCGSPGVAICCCWGWSGGAMVLGNLPVPGRPANLD